MDLNFSIVQPGHLPVLGQGWCLGSSYTNDQAALAFFTGYIIEKSLSVDNIFVFVLIFSVFAVPAAYQHRVLFWGIIGALLMRGTLIAVGAALLKEFHWVIYLFGGFLIFTGIRMAFHQNEEVHPEQNPLVKLLRKVMPVTENYEDDKFFIRRAGKLFATPLFLVHLTHRKHRPDLRRQLDPRHLRSDTGNVYRLYIIERICHSGTALTLLPTGRRGGQVPLP